MLNKLKKGYVTAVLIIFHTLLLFVVVNVICVIVPDPVEQRVKHYRSMYTSPANALKSDTALLKKVYPSLSVTEIASRVYGPNVKSHPLLELMNEPFHTSCYQVGIENIRYDSYIANDSVCRASLNGAVWVFGGSTIFGRGVCSDETISFYLNQLDSSNARYINMGCQGYNQYTEIEKLILLLRKGYKPSAVIFLDGLNDLMSLSRFSFEALETPSYDYHAYSMEFGPGNVKLNPNILYSIPVINWWYQYMANSIPAGSLPVEGNIYDDTSFYYTHPYKHFLEHDEYLHDAGQPLANKMLKYYQGNADLLKHLSASYQFRLNVFFQPLGFLYERNPFVKDPHLFGKEFFGVAQLAYLQKIMCDEIQKGKFPIYTDITTLDDSCMGEAYIDLSHYSPVMNKLVASAMLSKLKKNGSLF